jgi:hypothetical protein
MDEIRKYWMEIGKYLIKIDEDWMKIGSRKIFDGNSERLDGISL